MFEQETRAIRNGELVVFPTETVYGVATDALNPNAVERVYATKQRDRSKPISLAVPNHKSAEEYVGVSDRERDFMDEFLPGPVTVLLPKRDIVPDILTSGHEKVGIRVPDHEVALAFLDSAGPVTATSANISGTGSVVDVNELSDKFLPNIEYVIDDGVLSGGIGSTVVDVHESEIHRHGAIGDKVQSWLEEN